MDLYQQYSHSAIVLPVQNIDETVRFYVEKLDFKITFELGNPVDYVVGKLGKNTSIHFTLSNKPVNFNTSLYIFVHDVDIVHEILKKRSISIDQQIGDREYGMRDFDIYDNNGIRITFATSLK